MAQIRRAYFDIVANLLEVLSQEPCAKTKLASKANLDTRATHRYLTLIVRSKLASADDATNTLRITAKGKDFLEEYKRLLFFLEA
ncbi:MAG: winged helix-turn-helix domain-containing protein [Nitrososphaera sp.]|nr:winged helix-turn-helix domain-containing protein [Nitrososphaera sp.]